MPESPARDETKIEAVCRAMCIAGGGDPDSWTIPHENYAWKAWRKQAIAAIETIERIDRERTGARRAL